jgi:hypothetical protein
MNNNYYKKYLKYKSKYLDLKNGGFYCPSGAEKGRDHYATSDEKDIHNQDNICVICMVTFSDIKFIPCCHKVCNECYNTMKIKIMNTCPECRSNITNIFIFKNGNIWKNTDSNYIIPIPAPKPAPEPAPNPNIISHAIRRDPNIIPRE